MLSFRKFLKPKPYWPGRFHRGNYGFAKVLVRNSEIDRALDQDSAAFGRKFRVEKWKQLAKGP